MMEAGFIHDVSLEQKNDRDRISIENPSFHELMAVVPSDATFEPLELASRSFVKLESGGGCICICVCGGWMEDARRHRSELHCQVDDNHSCYGLFKRSK